MGSGQRRGAGNVWMRAGRGSGQRVEARRARGRGRRVDARRAWGRAAIWVSRFPQIDLGIVADIEASGFAFYLGIAADQGMRQNDVIEVGKGADNGILYNGIV